MPARVPVELSVLSLLLGQVPSVRSVPVAPQVRARQELLEQAVLELLVRLAQVLVLQALVLQVLVLPALAAPVGTGTSSRR